VSVSITRNSVVTVNYRIHDEANGELIEENNLPVSYIHGASSDLHTSIEDSLDGKSIGDEVEVILGPDEAFGQFDPNMVFSDDIANVPPEYAKLGAQAQFQNDKGEVKNFTVTKIEDGKVTLDGNHPLAGKAIRFVVTVKEIREASDEELQRGQPDDQYGGIDPDIPADGNIN